MKVWLMLTINKGYGVGSYDCKKKKKFIYLPEKYNCI